MRDATPRRKVPLQNSPGMLSEVSNLSQNLKNNYMKLGKNWLGFFSGTANENEVDDKMQYAKQRSPNQITGNATVKHNQMKVASGSLGENFSDSDEGGIPIQYFDDDSHIYYEEQDLSYYEPNRMQRTQDMVSKMTTGPAAHNVSSGSKMAAGPASGAFQGNIKYKGQQAGNGAAVIMNLDRSISSISNVSNNLMRRNPDQQINS